MTLSLYCACAAPAANAKAIAMNNLVLFFIVLLLSSGIENEHSVNGFVSHLTPDVSRSYAEIVVDLAHIRFELRVRNHVDHASALHDVVAVGDGLGEPE